MLNLGCGKIILPCEKPDHHQLVEDEIYSYPHWVNIDKNDAEGVDRCMNLFQYPWDLEDNAYSGALLSHVCEHIPHEIQTSFERTSNWDRCRELLDMQDGWFAFFSELYRVLEDGARVHIISPYRGTDGAVSDPTHTRQLNEYSFQHSMEPNSDAPFDYNRKLHFRVDDHTPMRAMPDFWGEPYFVDGVPTDAFFHAVRTRYNVVLDFYVRMTVVKD
jgi:hypothetical protein